MTKVIAFTNQKGGIGKTTLSIAFTRGLAIRGKKVLAVDIDPSGNFSANSGADREDYPTTLELLLGQVDPLESIQHLEDRGYYLIASPVRRRLKSPAFLKMLNQGDGPELALKAPLDNIVGKEAFDYIVIDTGPDLDDLTMCALFAADEIIVPTTSNANSLDGIPDLLDSVMTAQDGGNTNLKIRGILVNQFTVRHTNDREAETDIMDMSKGLNAPIFDTYIRTAEEVEKATRKRMDVVTFSPNHNVSKDIMQFVDEFLQGECNE